MSAQMNVELPDATSVELAEGSTARDLAEHVGRNLARAAVAAVVNGEQVDLSRRLCDGDHVAIVTDGTDAGREVLRHSTSHVLAQAVLGLWPGAHYAIGPAIEDGFYYDFSLPGGAHFAEEDLERIEERMRQIVGEGQPFVREEHTVQEARKLFADQPFKLEIIDAAATGARRAEDAGEGAGAEIVSTYRNSETFFDLCRGPHVPSTDRLGAFKLTRVAGAYWRGDERRPQLQRVYGTAWESERALGEHLHRLAEAERRDHRRLGT
jgi:threonyl-tRNA synthetase